MPAPSEGWSSFHEDHEWAHDLKFGPGFNTWVLIQWKAKEKVSVVWPYGWEGVTYEGSEKYQLPPWMVKQLKKK